MPLKETIVQDLTAAMKAREELKTSTLRMLKADIMKYEVSGADKVATDEIVVDILKRSVKQRKEAADAFEKGGNAESAQKELDEIKILEAYLPEQMSEDAVRAVVEETVSQVGASGPGDFGKVMGAVMSKVKGQADGGMVNKLVKEVLSV